MQICLEQKCGITLASYNVLYQAPGVGRINLKSKSPRSTAFVILLEIKNGHLCH